MDLFRSRFLVILVLEHLSLWPLGHCGAISCIMHHASHHSVSLSIGSTVSLVAALLLYCCNQAELATGDRRQAIGIYRYIGTCYIINEPIYQRIDVIPHGSMVCTCAQIDMNGPRARAPWKRRRITMYSSWMILGSVQLYTYCIYLHDTLLQYY
jgi:hypothetical protein